MDLSKIAEVHTYVLADAANVFLKKGWVLLTVRVVETQCRQEIGHEKDYIRKSGEVYYVVGRPRSVAPESS